MKYLAYLSIILTSLLTASCGEDRSGEFYALIGNRIWIEETMRENYLWYEEIPTIENENDYFQEPSAFFKKLLYKEALNGKGDIYSYMEENLTEEEETRSLTLDRTSTYGMEFELVADPTGTTTHTIARILYVLPGSPAESAGIRRGDWITAIDRANITSDNYRRMMKGGQVRLARDRILQTEEGATWQPQDTIRLEASVPMEINPFLVDTLYHTGGKNIAYLVYNEFSTGPNNDGTESVYQEQMKQLFTQFKSQAPDAFVLDLRYNNGGYLTCAQTLGSLLAPATALGKDFINLTRNALADPQTIRYPLDMECAEANLNLDCIYILTSSLTASASEALINGLIPYMGDSKVVLIGEKTAGKPVAMSPFINETYGLTLWPVVAHVSNADNTGNYANGFEPHYPLNERNQLIWYPLGDTEEYLLKNTLSLITSGSMPDIPSAGGEEVQALYNTITGTREKGAVIIHSFDH